jgi:integrase
LTATTSSEQRHAFRVQKRNASPTKRRYSLSETETDELLRLVDPRSAANPFNRQTRERNFLIFCLLLETGLRRGELCKLRVEDAITFGGEPFIKIMRRPDDPLDPRRNEPQVKTLERSIPISRQLVDLIINYLRHYRGRAKHPYLFCSSRVENPITLSGVDEIFQQVRRSLRSANVQTFTPHTLRRTFATRLAERARGTKLGPDDLAEVQNYLMGWSEFSVQTAVYTRRLVEAEAMELG